MKLSVLTNLYGSLTLEQTLEKLSALGVESIELGCGGYPGKAHCNPDILLADEEKLCEFKATIKKYGMPICALSTHGNPVHPIKEQAEAYDRDFRNAVLLAEKLGVDTVITFSGCPGSDPDAKQPNWVTCAWPPEYLEILDYQWPILVKYWKEAGAFAVAHGVKHIALEMHPGFCVYNPATCLKLREAVGCCGGDEPVMGANFDPSHLVWQGIDPVAAIRKLGSAIYHVHAKDTKIDEYNTAADGVLDYKHYSDEIHRSWVFRSVGYGHDIQYWKDMVSNLRLVGYDRVLSIEHEDSIMSIDEGLAKAVACVKECIIKEPKPGSMSWA